nr:hypothetical protein GCM10020093_023140 [Planobispora longispora]
MRLRRPAGIADAVALAWHAGPGTLLAYVALTVVGGAVPVVVSWLTKLLLDHLGAGHPDPTMLAALGTGLALAGAAVAVLPRTVAYVTDELRRSASLVADDRLYAAVNSFVGLGRFEDPTFLDRLRLAKQSGGVTPGRVVAALLALVRAGIGVAGFLGSLVVISPVMAVAVLAGPSRSPPPSSCWRGGGPRCSGGSGRCSGARSSSARCWPVSTPPRSSGCSASGRTCGSGCGPTRWRPTPPNAVPLSARLSSRAALAC